MAKKWIITIDEISESGDFACKTSKSVEGNTPIEVLNKLMQAMFRVIIDDHEMEVNTLKDALSKKDDDVPF